MDETVRHRRTTQRQQGVTMPTPTLLDGAGRRRSPATLPGYLCGRSPKNKGIRYPADPPRVEEIIAVMRRAGANAHGLRVRALVAVLWRAGLRISEALALSESDVDPRRGAVLVRHGKGDKRREAGMDDWGFEHLSAWLERRVEPPVGPLFCVIDGPTEGRRAWAGTAVRAGAGTQATLQDLAKSGARCIGAPRRSSSLARHSRAPEHREVAGQVSQADSALARVHLARAKRHGKLLAIKCGDEGSHGPSHLIDFGI
jgi:integrase